MVEQVNPFRLLITGSREWDDRFILNFELNKVLHNTTELGLTLNLIVGDCPTGADKMAIEWAEDEGVPCQQFEADWTTLGRGAGPARNIRMVVDGKPMMALAFLKEGAGNRGTEHCATYAATNGVPVKRVVGI